MDLIYSRLRAEFRLAPDSGLNICADLDPRVVDVRPRPSPLYRHQRQSGLLWRIQARARSAPRYLGLSMQGSRNSHCAREEM